MKKKSLIFLLAMLFLVFALRQIALPKTESPAANESEVIVK
jgi:hypothetical protein